MVRRRYTEEQIIAVLREGEAGAKVADLCRKYGMSDATYYNWKAKYAGLTVSFAKRVGARAIVRGLRMSADFEREFDMALMNKRLSPEIDVVCLMADVNYQFLSSSLLKEVASLDGSVVDLVPEHVAEALRAKLLVKP